MRSPSILVVALWLACCSRAFAEDSFVRVVHTRTSEAVGVLISEGGNELHILDLKTRSERIIPADKVVKVEKLSDEQMVRFVGLPTVIAYRIGQRSGGNSSGQTKGKVATVTATAIYINLGSSQGIHVGQKLGVFRSGVEITDPDTGKVLARERPKIAGCEIFEVSEAFSKGRLQGGLEIALKPGDEVDGAVARYMVAVLPIADDAGVETTAASAIREELVTALVKQNVPVVERSQLTKVLGETLLQNSRTFFEAAQAQEFGKQLGASVVVTGKIVTANKSVDAHLRLVNVATGEILMAVSGPIKDADSSNAGGKEVPSGKIDELIKKAREARFGESGPRIRDLAETKHPAAAKFLVEEMLKKDPFETPEALVSMGPVAADALVKVIETGDFSERIRAARIFVKVATRKHIPFLQKLTSDFHLKDDAQRAIKRIQSE